MFIILDDTDEGRAYYLQLLDEKDRLEEEIGHVVQFSEQTPVGEVVFSSFSAQEPISITVPQINTSKKSKFFMLPL